MFTVLIQTLGCKLNQLESEAIVDAFDKHGFSMYKPAPGAPPSMIVINTCTVTSKADQKARRVIRKALRDYPESCVLVTGCYAQLNREDLLNLGSNSGRRLFVFNKDNILKLPQYFGDKDSNSNAGGIIGKLKIINEQLGEIEKEKEKREIIDGQLAMSGEHGRADVFQFNPQRFSVHTRGFLKIQDGCDKHCTYCRIRLARGASVSLDAQTALERLRIIEQNHAEVVLTGVNICQYRDKNGAADLARLLEYLLSGTEKIALRLSSLAPESVDENLANILSHKRIRPHFHLSIQSGSKKVLEKMGRSYNVKTVEEAVTLLRRAKDDPFLACDIITGFPGETEVEFEETYSLCKKIDFAWIHVFPYSKRPGTPAWSFSGTVQENEVTRRVQLFTDLAKQGRADYVHRWLGRETEVLIEKGGGKYCNGRYCRGVSENYLKLLVQYNGEKSPSPGTVLRCKLLAAESPGDFDAIGEIGNFL
jgi:threonylcarbamoyladenosine tRNA methylthiotransferase MtaB